MKKLGKIMTLGFSALMCCALVTGCNEKQPTPKNNNKNELVLGLGYEPDKGFDPIKGSEHYGTCTSLFQTALYRRNADLKLENDLATEMPKISEDSKTYTITLRDDVKFSDGSPFSADDVVYTYETAKKINTEAFDSTNLESVKKLSDNQVEFTLKRPDIGFTNKMSNLGIVPKHIYEKDAENYGSNPVGTGRFKFVSWTKGTQLIVEPNPYYYGEKVQFKKITFLFLNDGASQIAHAKKGDVDIVRIPVTAANQKFKGYHLESLKTIDNRGVSFPYVPRTKIVEKQNPDGTTVKEKVINKTDAKTNTGLICKDVPLGNDITCDKAVRQAFNIALDRNKLIKDCLNGQGTKASSICDGTPWFNEATTIKNDGNIEKAKKILDDAGWKLNSKNIRQKGDIVAKDMKLWYAYDDRGNLANAFCEVGRALGFDLKPQFADWTEIEPKMYSELVLFGWGSYDPLELYNTYSGKTRGYWYYNTNFYQNPKVDEYFTKALSSKTEAESYDWFKKAQWDGTTGCASIEGADAPWVWMCNENHCYLVKDNLDIGKKQKIQPHGGGWPVIDTIGNWKRK